MANNKRRYINTRFWNDSFIADLDPSEKLLFIYILTNEHSNISGIYELPLKVIAIETGFDAAQVRNLLKRLKDKVRHIDGYIVVRNWLKHQDMEGEKLRAGVLNCLTELDKQWLGEIVKKGLYHISDDVADTLSIPYRYPSKYLDSNLDSNLDSIAQAPSAPAPFDLKKEIATLEDAKRRDLQIIGLYLSKKKLDIRSKEQLSTAIKRHLKAAKSLEPFADDQILRSFRKAADMVEGWTIETALKLLTK